MKILIIDGYNMLHRCRWGMAEGKYNIVYTFFRSLRSLVAEHSPDKVIFVLEGYPKFRHDLYPEYKANRKIQQDDKDKQDSYADFKEQKNLILKILSHLPVEVLLHPDYEADDLIGKLVKSVYLNDDCVISTGDTDFYQLIEECPNVKIYNPIKKEFVAIKPDRYILSKSLIGDSSDNISGIPKIGPKTAAKLLAKSSEDFEMWLDEKPERREILERNLQLIKFADVPLVGVQNLHKDVDFDWVRDSFIDMGFKSFLAEKTWQKFVETLEL